MTQFIHDCTSAKIIQLNAYGCRDAPCERSWQKGNPLSNTIRILAQSRVTLCLNYVGRVTHDCASIVDSHDFLHGASLHPYSFNQIFALVPHIFHGSCINAATCMHTFVALCH